MILNVEAYEVAGETVRRLGPEPTTAERAIWVHIMGNALAHAGPNTWPETVVLFHLHGVTDLRETQAWTM